MTLRRVLLANAGTIPFLYSGRTGTMLCIWIPVYSVIKRSLSWKYEAVDCVLVLSIKWWVTPGIMSPQDDKNHNIYPWSMSVHVYVCVRAYVCARICLCMHMCIHAYMCACICVCVRVYVCECVCVCACLCVCMHMSVHALHIIELSAIVNGDVNG